MAKGLEIRDAHFPGRPPIDAYGAGGFRFADMSHRGSILCLPSGVHGWDVTGPAELGEQTLRRVLEEAADIEVLLVGMGDEFRRLPRELQALLRERGIIADAMSTGSAVRTYNVLLAEDRAVAAALIAVDDPGKRA
ncbi:MAG: Mth938-like domain-containing protein [Oricola sp.]